MCSAKGTLPDNTGQYSRQYFGTLQYFSTGSIQTFLAMSNFTGFLCYIPNILPRFVASDRTFPCKSLVCIFWKDTYLHQTEKDNETTYSELHLMWFLASKISVKGLELDINSKNK